MARDYIERRQEGFYLIGTRVPLARIVYDFLNGETPEAIQSNFPAASLEQVYGAITFYLANKEKVEKEMAERRRNEEQFIREHPNAPELKQRLLQRREQLIRGEADR